MLRLYVSELRCLCVAEGDEDDEGVLSSVGRVKVTSSSGSSALDALIATAQREGIGPTV